MVQPNKPSQELEFFEKIEDMTYFQDLTYVSKGTSRFACLITDADIMTELCKKAAAAALS